MCGPFMMICETSVWPDGGELLGNPNLLHGHTCQSRRVVIAGVMASILLLIMARIEL